MVVTIMVEKVSNYLFLFQSYDEQEAAGDGGAGAQLRQLQPPAAQGAARGAQQLR